MEGSNLGIFFIVILTVFVIVVWCNYWRIQMMYNSSSLSLYTPPEGFPTQERYKEECDHITADGFKIMKRSTVVICALLRDVADRLPQIRKRSESVGRRFKDYRILIVENDSSDGTRRLLKEWRENNPKVIILGCGINSGEDTCHLNIAKTKTIGHGVNTGRIEKMTYLRNIYLGHVQRYLSHFDYCIAWDLDIIGTVYLDGIANSLGQLKLSKYKDADGMCAYGIYQWGPLTVYYDTYAHLDEGDKFHIDSKPLHDLKKGLGTQYRRGTPPKKVVSCFGGFTLYRTPSLMEKFYRMSDSDNLECEHVGLHRQLKNIYMNPSMIHLVLLNR